MARETPLRHPPVVKPPPPAKVARIPVKPLVTISDESTQTPAAVRMKTPRQFSAPFVRLVDKLKELKWFEEQYPLVKADVSSHWRSEETHAQSLYWQVFLENCDESLFPLDVLQRLDFIRNLDHRLILLKELENFYRANPISDQTREILIDKILFLLTKYDPANLSATDLEMLTIYFRLLVHINRMTIDVVAEFIYWYLDGGDRVR